VAVLGPVGEDTGICFRHVFLFFLFCLDQGTASQLASGACFRSVLQHFSSLTRWNGSQGQFWPEKDRKSAKTKI
jgi:hypothetical protein